MLASVYSYRVMVKSVSSCCVRGRRVLSYPVTYTKQTLSTDVMLYSGLFTYSQQITFIFSHKILYM